MANEICTYCNEPIEENPVPLYHEKRHNEEDPYMWQHEDCPKD